MSKELEAYLDVEEQLGTQGFKEKNFRKLLAYVFKYWGLALASIVLMFASSAAILLEPRVLKIIVDDVVIPRQEQMLLYWVMIYFGLHTFRSITMIIYSYLYAWLGQKVMHDLRMDLFKHIQKLPVKRFDLIPAGKLVTRATNDISSLGEMFTGGFVSIFNNVLVVLMTVIGLIWLDRKTALVALAVFPLMLVLGVIFSKMLTRAYRDARSKLSALNAFVAENIQGMKVVHLFNRQKLHLERFDRLNKWYTEAQFGTVRVFARLQPTITIFTGLSMALVIWYGGNRVQVGEIQLGTMVAVFSYVLSLFQPVREIADKWNLFLSGMTSAERVFSILSWEPEKGLDFESQTKKPQPRRVRGHIVFENVSHAYTDENWVLKDVSFEIQAGMNVGVVGPTGSGKTTLMSLLMRFYDPKLGRILLDGKDIQDFDKRELRSYFGMIQQDVFLFSGGLGENVSLWRGDLSDQELKTWLTRFANGKRLTEFSEKEFLQERGSNLSSGEKQMLSFARARFSNPCVWILDEATAHIDSETEKEIQAELGRVAMQEDQKSTIITIAHRLSTIREADLILVLNKGTLIEQGTHAQLLAGSGLYAKLYHYQEEWESGQKGLSQTV